MINVNLNKAKAITHEIRRGNRSELFKPLDIQATIPAYAKDAEAQRQAIRDQYEEFQEQIDNATCADELKAVLIAMNQ